MNQAMIFGIIDNGVLVVGMIVGVEFGEYLLPERWRSKTAGAMLGGFLGNAVSDGIAGLAISLGFTVGVVIGCLLPGVLLPLAIRRSR